MFEVEPVKTSLESPGSYRVNRPGSQALSPGRRDGPVGDVCGAVREIQVLQASATEQDATSCFDRRPDRIGLCRPAGLPARDPLPRFGNRVRPPHVPALDRLILIGVQHGPGVVKAPRPEQHAAADRQSGLWPLCEGTGRNG
jgi:hypothetical protein